MAVVASQVAERFLLMATLPGDGSLGKWFLKRVVSIESMRMN